MREYDSKGNIILSISGSKDRKVVMLTSEESLPIIKLTSEIEPVSVGNLKAIPWYDDNKFPQDADNLISGTAVLKRSLVDLTKITLGQGISPCEVIDTLPDGKEVLKMIKDPFITNQLNGYKIRRYLVKSAYDIYGYGSGFIEFVPNIEGTKILTLNPVSALKCRLEYFDNNGKVNGVLVSGYWPDAGIKNTKKYLLLDEIDPFAHLLQLRDEGELKKQTVFMHLKSSFSSNDFYPVPNWYAAKLWIDITQKVPKIISSGMDNVLNIFFLIKIPYSYWEKKYPPEEFETEKERRDKIEADISTLEEKFTSPENAKKALITHFNVEDPEGKWEIDIMQPKFSQENFVTSNAADTQIAIAAGISPDLLGLMYGNSKGGSMQRELLLLQYALSWEAREQLAEPIEMMLKFNQAGLDNLEIRFRNTFLTTLDTGAGTQTVLS